MHAWVTWSVYTDTRTHSIFNIRYFALKSLRIVMLLSQAFVWWLNHEVLMHMMTYVALHPLSWQPFFTNLFMKLLFVPWEHQHQTPRALHFAKYAPEVAKRNYPLRTITANRIQQKMRAINKPEIKPAATHNHCSFCSKIHSLPWVAAATANNTLYASRATLRKKQDNKEMWISAQLLDELYESLELQQGKPVIVPWKGKGGKSNTGMPFSLI